MMKEDNRELWAALLAILLITLIYGGVIKLTGSIPAAGQFFGHSVGVIGFGLMLLTETAYTVRKRSRTARWGKMSVWLQFHIFSGLVGPYMVLLHSSWKFNGLAGVVMLLTLVIVISGFFGRYIYTAVPRTVDGVEIEVDELERRIAETGSELENWLKNQPQSTRDLLQDMVARSVIPQSGIALILNRSWISWGLQRKWQSEKSRMDRVSRVQAQYLEKLLNQKVDLQRQVLSLGIARRMLSVWHTVHIPIGMALFTAAFLHIVGAMYYATLIH
jgi:hypothetical protein